MSMAPHYSCHFTRHALLVFTLVFIFIRTLTMNDNNNVNDTHLACYSIFIIRRLLFYVIMQTYIHTYHCRQWAHNFFSSLNRKSKPFLISYHFSFRPNYYSLLTFILVFVFSLSLPHYHMFFFALITVSSDRVSYCYLILCL